jgi:preprotein translocase subunit SecA
MAGRGTDIRLEEGIAAAGGLHIIGTERHESRRIDNQLRGRAGRQGDPGSSRFFVSLEDELMRRFGSERVGSLMDRMGMGEDEPIEHRLISKSIESAQTKVEGHNFDRRKHVVEYDDVMNRHREVIYSDRRKIVAGEDIHEKVIELIENEIEFIVESNSDEKARSIDLEAVLNAYDAIVPGRTVTPEELEGLSHDELVDRLADEADAELERVSSRFPEGSMEKVERHVLLMVIDKLWVDHLTAMDDLRQGVGLQAYGQKDPLVVYKTEGYRAYGQLQQNIQHDVVRALYRVQPAAAQQPVQTRVTAAEVSTNAAEDTSARPAQRKSNKVKPNQPCPCGSGKKYKFCHGAPSKVAV